VSRHDNTKFRVERKLNHQALVADIRAILSSEPEVPVNPAGAMKMSNETAAPMKSFEVERTTITAVYARTTVTAVDEYAAEAIARDNADTLEWLENDSTAEVDFSAEEQDENGQTRFARHAAAFRASL
jgi:hypothetical protein